MTKRLNRRNGPVESRKNPVFHKFCCSLSVVLESGCSSVSLPQEKTFLLIIGPPEKRANVTNILLETEENKPLTTAELHCLVLL